MPLSPLVAPSLDTRIDLPALPVTPDEEAASEAERPALSETIGAAFRMQNELGSAGAREDIPDPAQKEEGFSSYAYNRGTRFDGDERFLEVFNQRAADSTRRQIEREEEDRRTLEASGWVGTVAEIGAGIASPTMLLPGGAVVKGVRGGYAIGRTALATSVAAVAATGVQEGALQATQETRTAAETGFALGASALLGGFIGGGAAAILTRAERGAAEKAVRQLTAEPASTFGASGGAASVVDVRPGDLEIAGRAASAVASPTAALNPTLRLNTSPSETARLLGQQVGENSLYQVGNDAGRTAGPAVETLANMSFDARIYRAEKALDEAYKAMRKADGGMTRVEFEEAVGRAARRNDEGENEWVSRAAQAYRRDVLDAYKDEAISVGLLPENVKTTTADSYLHRMWNFQRLTARESEFKDIVRKWVARTVYDMPEAQSFDGVDDYARDIADLVYDKLTSRNNTGSTQGLGITMGPRGPLKERTFDIPDELVEDFLNSNIVEVGRRYARTMAADVELTKRFGRVDMSDQIAKVADEYRNIRESVSTAETPQQVREVAKMRVSGKTLERVKENALAALAKRERSDISDVEGLRDLVRGNYGVTNADGAWNRISRAANQINYIRLMGGVLVASIGDLYRPAMVHGLMPFMREGIGPLLTNAGRAARGMSVRDAQQFGLVVERYTQGRMATFAEIGDPYRSGTAVERLLENGTRIGSRWNGILMWTDAMKSIASVMTANRIIRGIKGQGDTRFLSYLGIDDRMRARIGEQLTQHADELDGVSIANVERWTDGEAARVYGAALRKDVNSVIVTKSVGDVPLFANTPTGRVILQFKSFMLASHQKVLLRGLQESPTRFVSGVIGMTTLGMMAAYARSWRGGEERFEKFKAAAENPGYLIGEGLDLSGIFSVPMEAMNLGEKIAGYHLSKDSLKKLFPDSSQQGSSVRYASRGVAGSLVGPTGGLIDLAAEVSQRAARAAQGEPTENEVRRLKQKAMQFVPYYSYPGMRELMNMLTEAD